MRYGFVKCAAATPSLRVADCEYNADAIIHTMREAATKGVHILVMPELCVTGYTCADLFLQNILLEGAEAALKKILLETKQLDMVSVIGLPLRKEGKLYNCAAVIYRGGVLGFVPKTHLPNYNEFYELRHFSPAPSALLSIPFNGANVPFGSKLLFRSLRMPDCTIAVELCEDLWAPAPPSVCHALAGATVLLNLSASDETIGKDAYRRSLVCDLSARLLCAYIYADAGEGESSTDMVFAAHNLIAEKGTLLSESKLFGSGFVISEIDVFMLAYERKRMNTFYCREDPEYTVISFDMSLQDTELTRTISRHPFIPSDTRTKEGRCETILQMQTSGLANRFRHAHAEVSVVGVSGGLDSCLALIIAARTMDKLGRPRSDILAVTMPCFGTTKRTRSNAERLAEALGVKLRCIDIEKSVLKHFEDINHSPDVHDAVYENAQARIRMCVLMDLANANNGLVIGTGDLSELALGWTTYNGDHMSMYGVNASIPKTLIRHIIQYCADTAADDALHSVLCDILDTPISPELLPANDEEISQITEEIVGPYELHDFFLYYAIRWGFDPAKVYHLAKAAFNRAYSDDVLKKWLRNFYCRFFQQQFKRSCIPDGPKVGSVALSPRGDWRMPSDATATLWLNAVELL